MRKGKSILGMKVISQADAADLGNVKDLIFDHESDELLALLISEKELFGLIDAQIVPWTEVQNIGPDAIMVISRDSKIRAGDDTNVNRVMTRETALSGTRILTTDGQDLGTLADMYIDETSGRVVGYEVSGGFFADTVSGKRFMTSPDSISIGSDKVALVPPDVAAQLAAQKHAEPGGLQGAAATVKEKVSDTYANIATASVEKQKAFVIGKTAGHDVVIPANKAAMFAPYSTSTTEIAESPNAATLAGTSEFASPPVETPSAGETLLNGDIVLVHKGETITQEHADRAESAGILHQLLTAVGANATSGMAASGSEHAGTAGGAASGAIHGYAQNVVVGKTAGREVTARDGSTIVAPGMTITQEIYDRAQAEGKDGDLVVSAGVAGATAGVETVKEHAAGVWETIKEKAAELTGAASDKKAEYDQKSEQSKINNALGRPTTRVILDQSDAVILNAGDLITHAAVDRARAAGVLEILLDSVYTADPEITPEMLRASEPGEAALPTQAQPSGGPITATVSPDAPAQDSPAQGSTS